MRVLLWVVGLFALAVGITVAARYSAGYVLLVLPTHRVELSVNLAVVLLLARGSAVFYLLCAHRDAGAGHAGTRSRVPAQPGAATRAPGGLQEALQAPTSRGATAAPSAPRRQAVGAGRVRRPGAHRALAARARTSCASFQARDDYLQQMEKRAPQDGYLRRP